MDVSCEWRGELDNDHLAGFHLRACGFISTCAGLIALSQAGQDG